MQNLIPNLNQFGINQTLHRIYLDINVKTNILTPFTTLRNEHNSRVLLIENVIVGEVPETYYFYDDLNIDSILDAN